jgi:alpha-D-ribose 1-methylphosphonate 5-triphosphate synthase subunit PhnI
MGYFAVKGGAEAIQNSLELMDFYRIKNATTVLEIDQIVSQLRVAVGKVMSEGSLYSEEYAAIAIKQAEGDLLEAAFIIRAFRTTLERRFVSEPLNTREMFIKRKISASFREIPGGQILGPSMDYSQRILDVKKAIETKADLDRLLESFSGKIDASKLANISHHEKVIDLLNKEGLIQKANEEENRALVDITREAIRFPAPRSARLQMMSRAETGSLMSMGYSSMRGFGSVHPTVGELRYGTVPVKIKDPRGRIRHIGAVEMTEAEMITGTKKSNKEGAALFSIGYGLCFGQNDTKVICMGILDTTLRNPDTSMPANDQEFVLYHSEGIEAMGFTNHLKLPHYVTFQSSLKNVKAAIERKNKP